MSIDMSQFHQVFFEECFEGLEAMESGLLDLNTGDIDAEVINTIFRGAHSIKGGSGTFGFNEVADFTHIMETLLDQMRDGRRPVTQPAIDVLLGSVDCLRAMLTAIQSDDKVDTATVVIYKTALEIELNGSAKQSIPLESAVEEDDIETSDNEAEATEQGWFIAFSPYLDLLKTGNDPVRLFRELAELGEYTVAVNTRDIPDFDDLDPEECNLSWTLTVLGESTLEDINEIFSWVEGDCEFDIQALIKKEAKATPSVKKDKPEPSIVPVIDSLESLPASLDVVQRPSNTIPSSNIDAAEEVLVERRSGVSSSIRVDTAKIDALINIVGEVVITQSMLGLVGENFSMDQLAQLKRGLAQLERHTRDMQQSVMNIRMLPINFVFSRFPRLVHDISAKLNKKIDLKLVGESTEVDKAVVELINDPLVHLIRNSLDHGIEMPADRIAAGKPEVGTIELKAYHRGGHIVIEIIDDGRGLDKNKLISKAIEKGLINENSILNDKQAFELIFMPGLSTAESVTDISGRGVGMDVV